MVMYDSPAVYFLADIGLEQVPLVGGKCANLGELIRAGLPVPPGFAITTAAFDQFIAQHDLAGEADGVRAALDWSHTAEVHRAAGALRERARRTPLPEGITDAVARAYWQLGALTGREDPPVAVRSSAVAEDSPDLSFAGVQDSFLWLRGLPAVLDGIRGCFASYFNPEALTYRREHGADSGGLSVAVQYMVDAWVAGVMFTVNPATGDPSTVAIEASWGLGTAVVNGEITPDYFLYSKITREIVRRDIRFKTVEYVPDALAGGVHARPVPPRRQGQACLSTEELTQLAQLGHRAERHYGRHQDLEWAVARQLEPTGGIYLLQSRPETVWSRRSRARSAQPMPDGQWPGRRDADSEQPAGATSAVSRITGYLSAGRFRGARPRG